MPDPFEVMADQPYEVQQSPPSNDINNPFDSLASSSTAQRRRESFTSTSTRSRSLSSSTDNNLERTLSDTPSTPWKRKSSFVQRDQLVRQISPVQLQQAAHLVRPPPSSRRSRHSLMMTSTAITPGMIYETPSSSSSSLPLHPPQPAFLGKARQSQQQSSEDLWSLGSDGNPNDETPLQTARRQSRLVEKNRGEIYHSGLPAEVIWPVSSPDQDFMPKREKSSVSIPSLSRRSSKISLSKKISRKGSGGALNGLAMSPTGKKTPASPNDSHSRAASIALSSAHSSTTSLHTQSVRGSKPPSTYSRDFLTSLAPREGGYAIAAQIGTTDKRKSFHESRAPVAKSGGMRWSLDGGEQYSRSPYTSRAGSEHSINTSSNLSTQPPIVAPEPPVETLVTPVTQEPEEATPPLPAGASPPSMPSTSSIPSEAVTTPLSVPSPLVTEPALSKKELKAKSKADAQQAARAKAEAARQAAQARAEQAQLEVKRKAQEKQDKADAKKQAKIDKQRAKEDKKKPQVALPKPANSTPPARPQVQKKPSFFGSIRKRFSSLNDAPPVPALPVNKAAPAVSQPPAPPPSEAVPVHAPASQALAPPIAIAVPPQTPPKDLTRSLYNATSLSPSAIPLPVSRSTTRTSPSPSRRLPSPPAVDHRSENERSNSLRRVSGPRANPMAVKLDYGDSDDTSASGPSLFSQTIPSSASTAPSSHDAASDASHDVKAARENSAETIQPVVRTNV